MAQEHCDRLTAIDASFLHQEGPTSHMHVGAADDLRGPAAAVRRVPRPRSAARLHLVPRYRQKLAFPPLETGRPLWVDDPSFNLEYHVRHTALPRPGSEEQLLRLAARIFSQQLDRSKPLWEMWLVEGLEDGRFALISKTHHALVDGIAGVDLATVLFDLAPGAAGGRRTRTSRGSPRREPSAARARSPRGALRRWCAPAVRLAGRARVGARTRPARGAARGARGGRGRRRGRLGRPEPGARRRR